MLWLFSIALTTALGGSPMPAHAAQDPTAEGAPAPIAEMLASPERRVRSTESRITSLIAEGVRRSRTFAAIVEALSATDVIVYVQQSRDLPTTIAGRLLMLPPTGSFRYLRVQVRAGLTSRELIALIGHELRHALEIAEDRTVRDTPGLVTLYQRIGRALRGSHSFDTVAAQDAGRQVRQELVG